MFFLATLIQTNRGDTTIYNRHVFATNRSCVENSCLFIEFKYKFLSAHTDTGITK